MSGPRYTIFAATAVFDKRLTPTNLRVLAAIGRHSNDNGWLFLKQRTLADNLDVKRQTVNVSIKKLIELGYLEIRHQRRKDGGNSYCFYRVILDTPDGPDAVDESRTDQEQTEGTQDPPDEGVSSQDDRPLSSPEVTGGVISRSDRPLSSPEVTAITAPELTAPINGVARADDPGRDDPGPGTKPPDAFDWAEGMRQELGMGPARNPVGEMRQVQAWLRDGIDLDAVARPTILAVAKTKRGDPASTLGYFDKPVRAAQAEGVPDAPGGSEYQPDDARLAQRVSHALQTGNWHAVWGNPPPEVAAAIDEDRVMIIERDNQTEPQTGTAGAQ